jgi:chaperonin GroEL
LFDDAYILVSDIEISNFLQIEGILAPLVKEGKKLLIIAPCSAGVINTFGMNVKKNGIKLCAIQPPSFGYRQHELMQDIAISVGATYFSEKTGDDLSHITFDDLGHAFKVVVNESSTIIIRSDLRMKQDLVDERVKQLQNAFKSSTKKNDKDFILERIASLTGGIGVIYAGGNTDLEQKELLDRIDDAVCAVRSALEEGVVPGAGRALFDINPYDNLLPEYRKSIMKPDKYIAAQIMEAALITPLNQILENAGLTAAEIYKDIISKNGYGYNLKTGEYGDLIEMGVVDPLKVTRSALQNAVSVAITILSTNAIVTEARSYETH